MVLGFDIVQKSRMRSACSTLIRFAAHGGRRRMNAGDCTKGFQAFGRLIIAGDRPKRLQEKGWETHECRRLNSRAPRKG